MRTDEEVKERMAYHVKKLGEWEGEKNIFEKHRKPVPDSVTKHIEVEQAVVYTLEWVLK